MKTSTSRTWLILALLSANGAVGEAQTTTTPGRGFQRLGKIKPRAAKDIASSTWSIGGETLDRDFGVYVPSDSNNKTLVDFTFHATRFTTPVYADLRTGEVYSIPKASWSRVGDGVVLRQIPVYDSPILIAEKGVLSVETTTPP
jgi:hypothetical protein